MESSTAPKSDIATLTVGSRDGTLIAYERTGDGPPLVLVDGALGFRSFSWSRHLAALLSTGFTVFCYDRRGRGQSGDSPAYAVEREIEDIEALIDAGGGTASLFGLSSGGALALEAAASLGGKVQRLAVYEIPYDDSDEGVRRWRAYRATLSELLAAGRRADAVALFMRFVGAPQQAIDGMRHSPAWATLEGVAPTLAYDAAVLGADRTVPAERAATVTAETLVMDGSGNREQRPFMATSAERLTREIPKARRFVLEGAGHDAGPELLAPVLADFLR